MGTAVVIIILVWGFIGWIKWWCEKAPKVPKKWELHSSDHLDSNNVFNGYYDIYVNIKPDGSPEYKRVYKPTPIPPDEVEKGLKQQALRHQRNVDHYS